MTTRIIHQDTPDGPVHEFEVPREIDAAGDVERAAYVATQLEALRNPCQPGDRNLTDEVPA